MIDVRLEAFAHRDGWLTVDTDAWIADRGEVAANLTDDLREWMDESGYSHADDEVIAEWVRVRTGDDPVGLHGDGAVWAHQLCNFSDHLLEDMGFMVFSASEFGDLMITVTDRMGCYVAPTVYRSTADDLEQWADYSAATGECAHRHRWHTNDTVRLHAADGADLTTYRLPDLVRVPFGDRSRAYVACPLCRCAVKFVNG